MCALILILLSHIRTSHKKVKGSIVFNLTYKTYVCICLPMHKYVVYQINNTDRQKKRTALCKYFKMSIWQRSSGFQDIIIEYGFVKGYILEKSSKMTKRFIAYTQWYILKYRILLPIWVHFWDRILRLKVIYGLLRARILPR